MKRMRLRNVALASSTLVCAMLLSVDWSAQSGLSVSTESAQARVGRPLTPVSVAGVARRQYRRSAYGYGYGPGAVGAGLAGAAVVGTAAAVAATSPWGSWGTDDNGYYQNGSYVEHRPLAANAYYGGPVETSPFYLQRAYPANGPWYGFNGWSDYKARYGIVCDPGSLIKGDDGLMHVCQ